MSMKTPLEYAQKSEYFKRNHVGKVTCTLCGIYCNDEVNFIKHLSGKTHMLSLERIEASERRRNRISEDEQRNKEAFERAEREAMAAKLLEQSTKGLGPKSSGSSSAGSEVLPLYKFRTEHNPQTFVTKVWLDFFFPHAEEGTRPTHRWVSAHEQQMEPINQRDQSYYVYLLVACEGYTTASLKFPSEAKRTTEEEEVWREKEHERRRHGKMLAHSGHTGEMSASETETDEDDRTAPRYRCTWNPSRRQYSIFFEMFR